jgi:beta-lactamase superfamily II metal-dependent hydrolase
LIVKAGDRLTVGDVRLDVLHPLAAGPEGSENARSLVLCVRHAGHALLTGDLEGLGLEQVLRQAPSRCDVLAVFRKNGGSPTALPRDNPAWSGGGQILRIDDDGVGVC